MIKFLNLNFWFNELLISPWYLNGWEFSHKHAPAMSVPVPVPDVYLIPVPIWYVQNLRPVQQCNPPTIKGWSYHTISCMFFRSHVGKAWWLMFGFAWVKHLSMWWILCHRSECLHICCSRPFPFPLPDPTTIKLFDSGCCSTDPLWCITYVQNSDIQNLFVSSRK